MGSDDLFDTLTLLAVLMIFAPICIFLSLPFYSQNLGGFDTQIEKTALYTESEIIPKPPAFNTDDVLLSLIVTDRYVPEPKKVRINVGGAPTELSISTLFLVDKTPTLMQANAAIPYKTDVTIELFSGPTGTRFWEVSPK